MHTLPLVVFLTLAAGPNRTIPAGCREDFETCREDCTIDYGGGTTKYRQLSECLHRCEKEQAECTDRHYSLQGTDINPLPAREPDPPREPEVHDAPDRDTTAPASGTEPSRDAVRRGVYRASESEPAAESKPASTKNEDMRVLDEPESESEPEPAPAPKSAPKPAPKPAEPPHPKPPAEPKKKDISDWDPNGD